MFTRVKNLIKRLSVTGRSLEETVSFCDSCSTGCTMACRVKAAYRTIYQQRMLRPFTIQFF